MENDELIENSTENAEQLKSGNNQYLTFKMGNDEFGVDILSVQEIHGWVEPRPMPDTPDFIKGVIDWRGAIVPIIDLRIRFDYESVTYDKSTVVIILKSEIIELNQSYILGIVVDAVSDVHNIDKEVLKNAPALGSRIDTQYIKGIAKVENDMIIILALSKLFKLEEFQ
ncbi:chemotaxis protein CheW [Aliikangiella sp. IMCC44359]|uniref:chemotaxis protein CheW n=1 Tax=Aliikangiella sp. IMCC44359 TaxID=3459125 RepID=UPI00403A7E1A